MLTRRLGLIKTIATTSTLAVGAVSPLAYKAATLLPRAATPTTRGTVLLKHYTKVNGQVIATVGRFPKEVVTIAQQNLLPGARLVDLWRGVNGYVTRVQLATDPPGVTSVGAFTTRRGDLLLRSIEQSRGMQLPFTIRSIKPAT